MTKKDYIKVAEILKEAKNNPDNWKLRNEDIIKNLIDEFSIMFKLDNRRFDKVKFVLHTLSSYNPNLENVTIL